MPITRILTEVDLALAASLLREGELVAFPTETVYGLGAPIFFPEAIEKIFQVKGRPSDNPLIAHCSSLSQVEEVAIDIPPLFFILAQAFCPGPLTIVLRKHPRVPHIASAGLSTLGIRFPRHPLAQALIQNVGSPLVAPSANLSGRPSATTAQDVLTDFAGLIAAVIDGGPTELGIESTVISLCHEEPLLLRPGTLAPEVIEEVLGCKLLRYQLHRGEVAASPGMRYRHYAPIAPIRLYESLPPLLHYLEKTPHVRRLVLSKSFLPIPYHPLTAATLYRSFRQADQDGFQEIVIYCDSTVVADIGLHNRILLASSSGLVKE